MQAFRVAAWIDSGRIQTTTNRALTPINAENLRAAHKLIETGGAIGKIALYEW